MFDFHGNVMQRSITRHAGSRDEVVVGPLAFRFGFLLSQGMDRGCNLRVTRLSYRCYSRDSMPGLARHAHATMVSAAFHQARLLSCVALLFSGLDAWLLHPHPYLASLSLSPPGNA